jgi:hypothetical protein
VKEPHQSLSAITEKILVTDNDRTKSLDVRELQTILEIREPYRSNEWLGTPRR